MPVIETKGAASAQGFGEFSKTAAPVYIEDVMSVWLYTGNGSTQTITNGIDLAGKGGLVWLKSRSLSAVHTLVDTARGSGKTLFSDLTNAQATNNAVTAFNSNGFTMGDYNNTSPDTFVSWTFRKQPKFFDVVTYTGNGNNAGQTINHNLGSIPGFIICKSTSATGDWAVCARTGGASSPASSITYATGLSLNSTGAALYSGTLGDFPTATTFSTAGIFTNAGSYPNVNGVTYVAYIFAHDAGGFGLTGTDNVISCGSFTTNSNGEATVSLGYEPQWMIAKRTDSTGNWFMIDTMRGWNVSGNNDVALFANTSAAEVSGSNYGNPTATGFFAEGGFANSATYIYIAIRRGPMKTPTSGTSVYGAAYNYSNDYVNISTGIVADAAFEAYAGVSDPGSNNLLSRLTGGSILSTANTNAQSGPSTDTRWDSMNGMTPGLANNTSGINALLYTFRRAPGFFDVVCYTGTGSNLTLNHNLGVAPELMIIKARSASSPWAVYAASEGINKTADLNRGDLGFYTETGRWLATPTATQFSVKPGATLNSAGQTQVAYLFASAAGVSKVGSYTGTGALQTINCGFTGGARWVMIKRADSAGDWFVYDSARGITSGNDPYLLFNSTAAQVTGTNYVDTTSVGFQVTAAAPAGLNANGGTYIFLAIA